MNPDLNDPVVYEIVAARVKMLFEKPFFGNLAARLILVDASSWCKTAATDGKFLYYNREFIKSLSKDELLFLVAHEILHVIMDHMGRRQGRDPKLWNMANDYIVNYVLVDEKVGSMPKMGLYDKRFTDEMTSEEVYDILKKDSVTIKMTLDEHLELGADAGDGDGDGDAKGQEVEVTITGKDGPPKVSEEDLQKIRNDLKAAMIQSAQAVGADKVPRGIRRMIDELVYPKMDWRELLDAHIRSSVKDDYSFQRPPRRGYGTGFILPTQDYMETIDIAVAIDCSGSMTKEMLRDFLSETAGIMQTFADFKVRLWVFDDKVYNYVEFTPENVDTVKDYPMAGGGGTTFEANWEFMKREGIEPQRFVMFTDGYPNAGWGDPNYCDTLFVIYGDTHQRIKAPFGITAYYEAKAN